MRSNPTALALLYAWRFLGLDDPYAAFLAGRAHHFFDLFGKSRLLVGFRQVPLLRFFGLFGTVGITRCGDRAGQVRKRRIIRRARECVAWQERAANVFVVVRNAENMRNELVDTGHVVVPVAHVFATNPR